MFRPLVTLTVQYQRKFHVMSILNVISNCSKYLKENIKYKHKSEWLNRGNLLCLLISDVIFRLHKE